MTKEQPISICTLKKKTLGKTEAANKNGKPTDIGNIGHTEHMTITKNAKWKKQQ